MRNQKETPLARGYDTLSRPCQYELAPVDAPSANPPAHDRAAALMDWQLGLRAATWLTLAFAFAAWLLALGSVYSMQNALGASARVLQVRGRRSSRARFARGRAARAPLSVGRTLARGHSMHRCPLGARWSANTACTKVCGAPAAPRAQRAHSPGPPRP